jgi:hypothetical protein
MRSANRLEGRSCLGGRAARSHAIRYICLRTVRSLRGCCPDLNGDTAMRAKPDAAAITSYPPTDG